MFRVYQVRFSSHDRRYRGQVVCRRDGHHHHHLFSSVPSCGGYNNQHVSSGAMPPLLNPTNYQSYIDTAQQLDSVALRKAVSQMTPELNANLINENENENKINTEAETTSSRTVNETSSTSRPITTPTTNDTQSSNKHCGDSTKSLEEKDAPDFTWINWDWPGSHTSCPFNPRSVGGQESTQAHPIPFLAQGGFRSCPIINALASKITIPSFCAKFVQSIKILVLRMKTAVRSVDAINVAVDVKEFSTTYKFVVDTPGLNYTNVKVRVENDQVLKINGELKRDLFTNNQQIKYVLMERNIGRFMRKFNLPSCINLDYITAICEDGLLTVVVPKNLPPSFNEPRTFDIPISSINIQHTD